MIRHVVRQLAVGGAVVLAGVGVVAVSAAQPGSAGCVVPGDASLQAVGTATADGHLAHQDWAFGPAGRRMVGAVNRVVESTFGHPDRAGGRDQLARGLIGSALDHHTRTVVVVVDPGRVDRTALRARLQAAAPSIRVDVRPGCFSAAELLEAEAVLKARAWHPDAASASYLSYLDASDSTYHVSFGSSGRDGAVAAALRRALGGRVTVTAAPASSEVGPLAGRFDDPPPHWGGANLYIPTGETEHCTSGFTVVERGTNRPGSVTAGHCGKVGSSFFSGTHDFGVVTKSLHDTTRDMAFITSTAAHPTSYDHFIYTDPGAPVVRNVVGRTDPVMNGSVCISGSITLAKCSVTVISLSGFVCGPSFCTTGLAVGRRAGVTIIDRGDSGAPVYSRGTGDGAIIQGMAIGVPWPDEPPSDTMAFHKVSQVEFNLNVTVSTG